MTEKKLSKNQKHAKKIRKQKDLHLRLSSADHELFLIKSKQAGLSLSEFLRSAATGKVITSTADQNAATELRRLGAMLKHFYPKEANWSPAEKRQYWVAMHTLLGVAKSLDGNAAKKVPSNSFGSDGASVDAS